MGKTGQSSLGTRALVQVQYPTVHSRLCTLLSGIGDRIDPPALTTGLPRTKRVHCSTSVAPAPRRTRVASSFRARAAYPAPTSEASPRLLVALGAAADVSASGDLFITFPTFDDLVPTPNVVMGMLTQHQPPHYPTQPGPRHAPASSLLPLALLAGGAPIIIAGPPASSACDGTRHLVIFGAYVHTRRPCTTRGRSTRLASLPRRQE